MTENTSTGSIKNKKNKNISENKNKSKINIQDKKKAAKKTKKMTVTSVIFFNLLITVVVVMCFLGAINNLDALAQRNERLEELAREHNSARIQNDALRDKLQKSREADKLSEDYIVSVARAHGLRRDSDMIFYIYSGE